MRNFFNLILFRQLRYDGGDARLSITFFRQGYLSLENNKHTLNVFLNLLNISFERNMGNQRSTNACRKEPVHWLKDHVNLKLLVLEDAKDSRLTFLSQLRYREHESNNFQAAEMKGTGESTSLEDLFVSSMDKFWNFASFNNTTPKAQKVWSGSQNLIHYLEQHTYSNFSSKDSLVKLAQNRDLTPRFYYVEEGFDIEFFELSLDELQYIERLSGINAVILPISLEDCYHVNTKMKKKKIDEYLDLFNQLYHHPQLKQDGVKFILFFNQGKFHLVEQRYTNSNHVSRFIPRKVYYGSRTTEK